MKARSRLSGNAAAMRLPLRTQTGAVLIGTLILLLTINIIGATLASLFLSVTTIAELELAQAQALYLAEAGIADSITRIRAAGESGTRAPLEIPLTALGGGTYAVDIDPVSGVITATGEFQEVQRTIQIKYHVF